MRINTSTVTVLSVLAAAGFAAASASAQTLNVLFTETFDNFTLFPNFEEGILTGNPQMVDEAFFGDAVDADPFNGSWSSNGWSQTFALAGVGTAEWEGWTIADRDFWMMSDFQRREEFTLASGNVAVADPDEWDDFDPAGLNPDAIGFFTSFLTSPSVNITGVSENTLVVRFDSSWRDEDDQIATIDVSYDGGPWIEVLRWESDQSSPFFKDDATNETVQVSLNNPSGVAEARLRFGMPQATNDWWWAIDNVQVAGEGGSPAGPPLPFSLFIDTFNSSTTPTLTWQASLNAVQYDVIVANDAAFADVVFTGNTGANSFALPGGAVQAGAYYIKVVASNNEGSVESSGRFGFDNAIPADIDGSGSLNIFDILGFLEIYSSN